MANFMKYNERPAEYEAVLFDTAESAYVIADWLRKKRFNAVRFVDTMDETKPSYIEYEGHKIHIGSWLVLNPDGSSDVYSDREFQMRYVEKAQTTVVNVYNDATALPTFTDRFNNHFKAVAKADGKFDDGPPTEGDSREDYPVGDYVIDKSKHNEDTLFKVRNALIDDRFREDTVTRIINILSNAGILFRERI